MVVLARRAKRIEERGIVPLKNSKGTPRRFTPPCAVLPRNLYCVLRAVQGDRVYYDEAMLSASTAFVAEAIQRLGPIDGLAGFSQARRQGGGV